MRRSSSRLPGLTALLVFTLLVVLPQATFAFSDEDRAASRAIIERQIEAFREDDGATAFGFASPALQGIFRDPDNFMAMVRNGYQPVYRPRNFAFGNITETESGLTATLSIEDAEGHAWTAIYTLEKQPDGSWRISSCRLERVGVSA
jgi:Domain of unknown function (DUF4864)